MARNSAKEPTEMEFQIAMESVDGIKRMCGPPAIIIIIYMLTGTNYSLYDCRLEMLEGSTTQLNGTPSPKLERKSRTYICSHTLSTAAEAYRPLCR
jgi:hypothetical protein